MLFMPRESVMKQVITAKLKLSLSSEQKQLIKNASLAYRDALNYTSQVAIFQEPLSYKSWSIKIFG